MNIFLKSFKSLSVIRPQLKGLPPFNIDRSRHNIGEHNLGFVQIHAETHASGGSNEVLEHPTESLRRLRHYNFVVSKSRYISSCADKVKLEYESYKIGKCRTFGRAEESLVPPDQFLKKNGGMKPARPTVICHKHQSPAERTSIPKAEPLPPRKPPVNYRLQNIRSVLEMKPKPRERMCVVNWHGDQKKLEGSGEIPEYCRRATYAQVPLYLIEHNRERKKMEEERHKKNVDWADPCQLISQEKRLELIEGLKHNWDELNITYQRLPLIVDAYSKIKRKEEMEANLDALEKDIAMLEENPYVYVFKDGKAPSNESVLRRKERGN